MKPTIHHSPGQIAAAAVLAGVTGVVSFFTEYIALALYFDIATPYMAGRIPVPESIFLVAMVLELAALLLIISGMLGTVVWNGVLERGINRRVRLGLCAQCGYDLRGSVGSRKCPECGFTTEDYYARLQQS